MLFTLYVSANAQWTTSGVNNTYSNANTSLLPIFGTVTNQSLQIRTNNITRFHIHQGGNIGVGINAADRRMHIHGTGSVIPEKGSTVSLPGSESMLVLTNTESGPTAWDGLRLGLANDVAMLATEDKLKLLIKNGPARFSLYPDGKITMFENGASSPYDAQFGLRAASLNGMLIDNPSNPSGYSFRVLTNSVETEAVSVRNSNSTLFVVKGDGRVGIATSSIASGFVLDVNGRSRSQNMEIIKTAGSNAFVVRDAINTDFVITNAGIVGIGTNAPSSDYRLDIAGKARACEVRVNNPGWCDYVFEPTYNLMPLSDLKSYLKENKHLPEMPSEKEVVEAGGFDLAQMNVALLKRSEENTLYILELEEKINKLARVVETQTKLIEELTTKSTSNE